MKKIFVSSLSIIMSVYAFGQLFEGNVNDAETGSPLDNVTVSVVDGNLISTITDVNGEFSLSASDNNTKTLRFYLDGYMFEEQYNVSPSTNLEISLRKRKKSAATLRQESYVENGCNTVNIPNDPNWNIAFKERNLEGDLAPDRNFTRRDPSAVIFVNDKYYVWYSYSLTQNDNKIAPWDLNDLYYATSSDGITWKEEGPAVTRGPEGAFDHRSVFTTEIFVHDGKYYLVYQAAETKDGVYNRNTVGMSWADSPDGPWTKLSDPVLRPTYTDDLVFDNNAVHDPAIIFFEGKFHLYYKGECNCRGKAGCKTWCNPVCSSSTNKQVKWGVAIADSPTGPYTKSEFNPITNTGHEVMVWTYDGGVAILQHQDGPEGNSIQFAEDGINFKIKGSVSGFPEAAGIFRPNNPENTPHGGIPWGMSHQLVWNFHPNGWMHIKRFDKIDLKTQGLLLPKDTVLMNMGKNRTLTPIFTPPNPTDKSSVWSSSNTDIVTVDENGMLQAEALGTATIFVRTIDNKFKDSTVVKVTVNEIVNFSKTLNASSYTSTGNLNNIAYGGEGSPGAQKSGSSINFVNANDWMKYTIDIPNSGNYNVSYEISTPQDDAGVQLIVNNQILSDEEVASNGTWDNYYTLTSASNFFLAKGQQEIQVLASGSNEWQWNLRSVTISGEIEVEESITDEVTSLGEEISSTDIIFPNPGNEKVYLPKDAENIIMLDASGKQKTIRSSVEEQYTVIDTSAYNSGLYFITFSAKNQKLFFRFVKE